MQGSHGGSLSHLQRARRVLTAVTWTFAGFLIAVTLLVLLAQHQGYRVMYVVSDSMVPSFATGAGLLVDVEHKTPQVGDVVAFSAPWHSHDVVVHRVLALQGTDTMETKGDANTGPDPLAPQSSIIGVVVGSLPFVGTLLSLPWILVLGVIPFSTSMGASYLRHRIKKLSLAPQPIASYFDASDIRPAR